MKTSIAENKLYHIHISKEKNRAYLKIIGFWRNPEAVPEYISDWRKSVSLLKKGFTLLTDASEMKTHPQEMRKVHEEAQKLVMEAGLTKVAEVIPNDITEYQLDSIAQSNGFPKKSFRSLEEAEKWLDA